MRSDRQPGTALGTTGIDHAPAILGAHACTETVGPFALQVTGLKSSFHGLPRLNSVFEKSTLVPA
jgi:hypothetical protein